MKLELIKNAVTSKVGRQILIGQKHSPTLFFAGGVVGVVTTTVLACRATLKLEEVLEEAENLREQANTLEHKDYSEADRKQDHARITIRTAGKVTKLYAPAIAVGVVSIAALTGSHVVLSKRNAGLVAAYSALDKGFSEYRERVRDELGDNKDQEFRHGVETKSNIIDSEDGKETVEQKVVPKGLPSVYARFFDDTSTSWSREAEYNRYFLSCQQNYANDLLRARGHIFLNEVYDMLGLPRNKAGAVVGWVMNKDGDNFVDFGIFNGDLFKNRDFVNGREGSILLDFNVDGVIFDQI